MNLRAIEANRYSKTIDTVSRRMPLGSYVNTYIDISTKDELNQIIHWIRKKKRNPEWHANIIYEADIKRIFIERRSCILLETCDTRCSRGIACNCCTLSNYTEIRLSDLK
jgi:hypothetical protein